MKPCQINGCSRPARARGWCRLHYRRWLAHGDPLAPDGRLNARQTPEQKAKTSAAITALNKSRTGIPLSKETRQKMREARLGYRHSPETRAKIGAAQRGERGNNWKGDAVGYKGLHDWVAKNKVRTGICEQCGSHPNGKGTEFANISGMYRRDANDFIELCVTCHKRFDRSH